MLDIPGEYVWSVITAKIIVNLQNLGQKLYKISSSFFVIFKYYD